MPNRAGIPHNKWILCAAAGAVLFLWAIWQIVPLVRHGLSGRFEIVIVN